MKLNHAKAIVNEPRYLEAQKVIAEAEVTEIEAEAVKQIEKHLADGTVPPQATDPVEEPVDESTIDKMVDEVVDKAVDEIVDKLNDDD